MFNQVYANFTKEPVSTRFELRVPTCAPPVAAAAASIVCVLYMYVTLAGNFRGTNSCNLIHFSTFFYRIMTDWRQTTLPRFFHQHQTTEQTIQASTSGSNSGVNPKSLGGRSKSQDAIRNHRKTVRFVSDKQQYQPILDSTNIGGYNGGGSRPDGRGELGHSGPGGPGGGGGVKGRSFFLLSMLQGGDPSSSSGRAKSSKVTTFLHFFFLSLFFSLGVISHFYVLHLCTTTHCCCTLSQLDYLSNTQWGNILLNFQALAILSGISIMEFCENSS